MYRRMGMRLYMLVRGVVLVIDRVFMIDRMQVLLLVFVIDSMQVCLRMQVVCIVFVINRMLMVYRMQVLAVVLVYPGVPAGHPLAVDVVCHLVTVYVFFYMLMRPVVLVVYIVLMQPDMRFRTVMRVFVVVLVVLCM